MMSKGRREKSKFWILLFGGMKLFSQLMLFCEMKNPITAARACLCKQNRPFTAVNNEIFSQCKKYMYFLDKKQSISDHRNQQKSS